jgi:hypothetical protein
MNYSIKSPMLVKQISNPGFNAAGQDSGSANGRPSRQYNNRQISSPAMMMMTSSPLLVKPNGGVNNPNVVGRRIYGGPRLLINPKVLTSPTHQNNNKSGSISSLNSSGGSGLDISMTSQQQNHHKKSASGFGVPPSPVVRPPTNAQDRPSFFNNNPGNRRNNNTDIW